MVPDPEQSAALRAELEAEDVEVTDLYLWIIGPGQLACAATVIDRQGRDHAALRARLQARLPEQPSTGLVLVLIEVVAAASVVSESEERHSHGHDHGHGHGHHH